MLLIRKGAYGMENRAETAPFTVHKCEIQR
jgi:hypothetical protein